MKHEGADNRRREEEIGRKGGKGRRKETAKGRGRKKALED